jgi:hypothetical protein
VGGVGCIRRVVPGRSILPVSDARPMARVMDDSWLSRPSGRYSSDRKPSICSLMSSASSRGV